MKLVREGGHREKGEPGPPVCFGKLFYLFMHCRCALCIWVHGLWRMCRWCHSGYWNDAGIWIEGRLNKGLYPTAPDHLGWQCPSAFNVISWGWNFQLAVGTQLCIRRCWRKIVRRRVGRNALWCVLALRRSIPIELAPRILKYMVHSVGTLLPPYPSYRLRDPYIPERFGGHTAVVR